MKTMPSTKKKRTKPAPSAQGRTSAGKNDSSPQSTNSDTQESVSTIIAQWQREKPRFDTGPMALFGALARAFLLTSPAIEKFLAKYGLARGMFDVLAALRRSGAPYRLPPSQLSKSLMLSGAGMTSRLDRLENLKLVARQPEPNDRRSVRIQLTPKGLQLVEKIIPQLVETERGIIADFGDANTKKLTQLLLALNETLSRKK
jgi:DNA-binding MarR family transcriptional regulator